MNKLKFRVWDKATKTMHKENSGFFLFTNGVLGFNSGNSYEILNKEDFVVMQFSGTGVMLIMAACVELIEPSAVDQEIPEWWWQYKKANPHNKDDYNKREHCCSRFWKDFCNCVR